MNSGGENISLIFKFLVPECTSHDFSVFEDVKTFKNKSEKRCETPPTHTDTLKTVNFSYINVRMYSYINFHFIAFSFISAWSI